MILDDFIDDLKQYIKTSVVALNSNFSALIVDDAYVYEKKPTPPEIDLAIVDYSDDDNSNSYENENVSIVVLNIYCYANAMKFDNNTSKSNAVISTRRLADCLAKCLNKTTFQANNNNVISSTRQSYTGAMSVEDSSLYVAIFRYNFKIRNNYDKIYNE